MKHSPDTFETLYRKHAPGVFRRAKALLGNEADAHEVVQDLFLGLHERPHQWSGKSSLSTYLYSAATHSCLNMLRDRRNRVRLLREQGTPAEASPLMTDAATIIRNVLDQLPPPLGDIAVYYYVDELTHEEIAQILGCSRRHVGHCIERLLEWGRAQTGEMSCSKN